MTRHNLPIIILAAGASSRMRGRDKLLEEVDGLPLLRQQALKACAVTNGPVLVALPTPPHARYDALRGLEVLPFAVPDADEGMNASLRRAFAALPSTAPCAMVLLGDLPDVTAGDLATVADAIDLNTGALIWRGATQDGGAGHPIIFDHTLFPAFADLTGDSGGREVVAQAKGRVTLVPLQGQRARLDLDTPEDWENWRRAQHPPV
ncbi:nucleotidyltransferase family protein [Sulfitobacter sp. M57]|uniref:nucleotidyltransferase family protein n=1 Tax=unclassified Sulfitobacter TaxID=196795 RepID=UPI0023E2C236|nr:MULTISPECIES: nucleotidyltransferase family protein [unclassified Sulfitobacter]MDF3413620.1 nucleotidyltransferase family protein [Sulfitobacter sp. KE5]MDF3421098.1 nucleotidyltransferase family protein [Sulfitobacter sp. KE43]MDF3432166.1 nucleotidyltransferase family protein [Sulfitobacter sp. KE42]MDF3457806.1 nucleotidyltransferase family protein [Sulfitobacter sp. S74]MDF3461707.1 nucleotidyltransferase family protein [Sulfitobacter sp. Ks18]